MDPPHLASQLEIGRCTVRVLSGLVVELLPLEIRRYQTSTFPASPYNSAGSSLHCRTLSEGTSEVLFR